MKINIVDCIIWQGKLNQEGYGYDFRGFAYRTAYQAAGGVLIKGLEIDHLCRNHACINPNHLEQVTHQINVLRGTGAPAINAIKTHCVKGHKFDKANTRLHKGHRYCKKCQRIRNAWQQLNKVYKRKL